jgi:hypothetical protein
MSVFSHRAPATDAHDRTQPVRARRAPDGRRTFGRGEKQGPGTNRRRDPCDHNGPLIVMLAACLAARSIGAIFVWHRLTRGLARSASPWRRVRVHGGVTLPSPHATGLRPDGARESARAGTAGVGSRGAGVSRRHRPDAFLGAACGGLRPDRATRGDIPCERPRRTGGTDDRRSPRRRHFLVACHCSSSGSPPSTTARGRRGTARPIGGTMTRMTAGVTE